jgi:hypothetical protein
MCDTGVLSDGMVQNRSFSQFTKFPLSKKFQKTTEKTLAAGTPFGGKRYFI